MQRCTESGKTKTKLKRVHGHKKQFRDPIEGPNLYQELP